MFACPYGYCTALPAVQSQCSARSKKQEARSKKQRLEFRLCRRRRRPDRLTSSCRRKAGPLAHRVADFTDLRAPSPPIPLRFPPRCPFGRLRLKRLHLKRLDLKRLDLKRLDSKRLDSKRLHLSHLPSAAIQWLPCRRARPPSTANTPAAPWPQIRAGPTEAAGRLGTGAALCQRVWQTHCRGRRLVFRALHTGLIPQRA
eukprot:scaffold806_cov229-Pinguiococcus_pyrenoidosus.AAC.8